MEKFKTNYGKHGKFMADHDWVIWGKLEIWLNCIGFDISMMLEMFKIECEHYNVDC
jgi:hypothetical protein